MSSGVSNGSFTIQDLDVALLERVITAIVETTGGGVEVLNLSLARVAAAGWLMPSQNESIGNLGKRFSQIDFSEFWSRMPERAIQETKVISQLSPDGVFFFAAPVFLNCVPVGVIRAIHNVPTKETSDDNERFLVEKTAHFEYTLVSAICEISINDGDDVLKNDQPIALANIRRVFEEILINKDQYKRHSNIPTLRELVSPSVMDSIIKNSADALMIPITIIDLGHEELGTFRSIERPACNNIHEISAGRKACTECYLIRVWQAILSRDTVIYSCYAGFCGFAVPIFVDNTVVGTVISGQMIPSQREEEVTSRIQKYMVGLGIDENEAKNMLSKHPHLSDDRINATGALMKMLSADVIGKLAVENWLATRNLEAITRIGGAFQERRNRDEILKIILMEARELANCDSGNICLLEQREESGTRKIFLRKVQAIGKYWDDIPEEREVTDVLADMVDHRKEQVIRDKKDEKYASFHKLRQRHDGTAYGTCLSQSGSVVYIPLFVGERVYGMLSLGSDYKDQFGEDTVLALLNLAASATVAIHSSEMLDVLDKINAHFRKGLIAARTALGFIHMNALELIGCRSGTVRLLDEETNELVLVSSRGCGDAKIPLTVPIGEGISGEVVGEGISSVAAKYGDAIYVYGNAMYVKDVNAHKGAMERKERLKNTVFFDFLDSFGSTVVVLLRIGDIVIGDFSAHKAIPHGFTEDDVRIFEMVANQAIMIWTSIWQKSLLDAIGNAVEGPIEKPERVLDALLNGSMKLTGANAGALVIVEGNTARLGARSGELAETTKKKMSIEGLSVDDILSFDLTSNTEKGIIKHAIQTKKLYNCPDVENDPRYLHVFEGTKSKLVIPIMYRGEILVAISHESLNVANFKQVDVILLKTFAQVVAPIVYNAQAFKKVIIESRLRDALGEVANQFAHEMRNPLNNIQAACSIIEILPSVSAEVLAEVRSIRRNVSRIDNVAQDLLDFSKGLRSVIMETVDLHEIIDIALNNASQSLGVKNIRIYRDSDWSTPIIIVGSGDHLVRAFRNLISNAVDAMELNDELHLMIQTCPDTQMVCAEIRDTGSGMPEDVQLQMFNLFFTTKRDGTGLGLWIVQRVVEMHQGDIEVNSKDGKGTAVRLLFPRHSSSYNLDRNREWERDSNES